MKVNNFRFMIESEGFILAGVYKKYLRGSKDYDDAYLVKYHAFDYLLGKCRLVE